MPNGLEPFKILRTSQGKVPRFGWEAARRKRAGPAVLYARLAGDSSIPEGAARRPKVPGVLPGGSAERPGVLPGSKTVRPGCLYRDPGDLPGLRRVVRRRLRSWNGLALALDRAHPVALGIVFDLRFA